MRWIATLLVLATACHHGRVSVAVRDVASHVEELHQLGLGAGSEDLSRT